MSNRRIIVVTSLITFMVTSAIWVSVLLFAYWDFSLNPPAFLVNIESPDEVALNQEFELVISVTNVSDSEITLGSIDIYDSLLDGFEIISIEPKPREISKIMGFHSSYFYYPLSAQEQFMGSYTLRAKEEGLWIGDIDSCTPFVNFVTVSKAIKVTSD